MEEFSTRASTPLASEYSPLHAPQYRATSRRSVKRSIHALNGRVDQLKGLINQVRPQIEKLAPTVRSIAAPAARHAILAPKHLDEKGAQAILRLALV